MPTSKELRTEAGKLHEQAQAILTKAAQDGRKAMSAEEEARFDALHADIDKYLAQAEKMEQHEQRGESLSRIVPASAGPSASGDEDGQRSADAEVFQRGFVNWLRRGVDGLTAEERAAVRSCLNTSGSEFECRAQGVGSAGAGGATVPQGFVNRVEKSLKAFGGMRQAATILPTGSGNDLPWPTVDDTAQTGELLGENTAAAQQDATFSSITFKAYKYSSKEILVSTELLEDSGVDIEAVLTDLLVDRIGRITNAHFTTGTGSAQPQGVVTASSQGKVGTTGQTTSIIYDDLVDLEHSVDPAYRNGAIFQMADSSLKVIKKLKDTTGRPLWLPGLVAGEPASILGYGYVINQDVAAMAANAKSVLFGNFKKYMIRDVRGLRLRRLVERYGEKDQVSFVAFSRHDGRMLDAGTDPVKHYANSAT